MDLRALIKRVVEDDQVEHEVEGHEYEEYLPRRKFPCDKEWGEKYLEDPKKYLEETLKGEYEGMILFPHNSTVKISLGLSEGGSIVFVLDLEGYKEEWHFTIWGREKRSEPLRAILNFSGKPSGAERECMKEALFKISPPKPLGKTLGDFPLETREEYVSQIDLDELKVFPRDQIILPGELEYKVIREKKYRGFPNEIYIRILFWNKDQTALCDPMAEEESHYVALFSGFQTRTITPKVRARIEELFRIGEPAVLPDGRTILVDPKTLERAFRYDPFEWNEEPDHPYLIQAVHELKDEEDYFTRDGEIDEEYKTTIRSMVWIGEVRPGMNYQIRNNSETGRDYLDVTKKC